jgi:hypothetical protein
VGSTGHGSVTSSVGTLMVWVPKVSGRPPEHAKEVADKVGPAWKCHKSKRKGRGTEWAGAVGKTFIGPRSLSFRPKCAGNLFLFFNSFHFFF